MRLMIRAFKEWLERRRRFAEEWRFHRERAAFELEALGLDRLEAEGMASSRMGRRSRYRREALREIGGDIAGLLQLLLPERSLHTAWTLPASLGVAIVLLFGLNPGRQPVWQTVVGTNFADEVATPNKPKSCAPRTPSVHFDAVPQTADPCVERAPWVRHDAIPAAFGKAASWIIFVVGLWPLTRFWWNDRKTWRLLAYGAVTMSLLAFFAVSLFVTAMQYHSLATYPYWLPRAASYLSYTFAHTLCLAWFFRFWRRDVDQRCPNCLEMTRMPMERGRLTSPLLDPLEVESVCILGHGTLTESHWDRRFQDSRSFWEDLAGAPMA